MMTSTSPEGQSIKAEVDTLETTVPSEDVGVFAFRSSSSPTDSSSLLIAMLWQIWLELWARITEPSGPFFS